MRVRGRLDDDVIDSRIEVVIRVFGRCLRDALVEEPLLASLVAGPLLRLTPLLAGQLAVQLSDWLRGREVRRVQLCI